MEFTSSSLERPDATPIHQHLENTKADTWIIIHGEVVKFLVSE
jgi:hypothetical protein